MGIVGLEIQAGVSLSMASECSVQSFFRHHVYRDSSVKGITNPIYHVQCDAVHIPWDTAKTRPDNQELMAQTCDRTTSTSIAAASEAYSERTTPRRLPTLPRGKPITTPVRLKANESLPCTMVQNNLISRHLIIHFSLRA